MCHWLESLFFPLFPDDPKATQRKGLQLEPRFSYKSSIAAKALPLLILERYPNSAGLIDCHAWGTSMEKLSGIKSIIERNHEFREVFGDWKTGSTKWTEDGIIINRRTQAGRPEPSIDTSGVDKAKTGGHYDWIIADDLHSETNASSVRLRMRVRDHIENLYPLLSPTGVVLLIGTRWHLQDAYGWLIHNDQEAEAKGERASYRKRIMPAIFPDGRLYFPHRLTHDFLAHQRADLTEKKFSVWYYNQPIEEGSRVFTHSYIQYFDGLYEFDWQSTLRPADFPSVRIPIKTFLLWDPAGVRPSTYGDFHGVIVAGVDKDGNWVILEAQALKLHAAEIIARMIYLIDHYHIDSMSIEDVSNQLLWKDKLIETLALHNSKQPPESQIPCPPIYETKPSSRMRKNARIETALQPKFKARQVWIRKGLRELVQQLNEFPQLDHDDLVDALAQLPGVAQPAEELSPEDIEDTRQVERPEGRKRKDIAVLSGAWVGLSTPLRG